MSDRRMVVWDVATRAPLGELFGPEDPIWAAFFSPNKTLAASMDHDGNIMLWNMDSRKSLGELPKASNEDITSLAFSWDDKLLATGSPNGTVMIWGIDSQKSLGEPLRGHKEPIGSAFSPDGKVLATVSIDGSLILWDLASRRPLGEPLKEHKSPISGVVFSPNGKLFVTKDNDEELILWNLASRKPIGERLEGSLAVFSPDSKLLVVGLNDTLIVRDAASGKSLGKRLVAPRGKIGSIAFSPNGKLLATGTWTGTVNLWDMERRAPIGDLLVEHQGSIVSLDFDPDGKLLATGSSDGSVIVWDVDPSSWQRRACTIANRNLTHEEWRKYMGDLPYRKTCPDLPGPDDAPKVAAVQAPPGAGKAPSGEPAAAPTRAQ